MSKARTDPQLREALRADWKTAFRKEGLAIPRGELLVVEEPVEGAVLVLPRAVSTVSDPRSDGACGSPGSSSDKATAGPRARESLRPSPQPEPRDPKPRPPTKEVVTTLRKLQFKRWNGNPFGPGCKNDGVLSFTIPSGAVLHSITVGEGDCGPVGADLPVGRYVDSHVALGIRAGGVALNYRPVSGRSSGNASVGYHWWFNQWGHVAFTMCVNVRHKPTVSVASESYFDHVNMDDGLKSYRINTPLCLNKLGVTVSGNTDGSAVKVRPDVSVKTCENGAIWWFGCKNDRGDVISF
ncbi:MAG TPA: hypothetical protein VF516_27180 [Kofleriaceae bacterium]